MEHDARALLILVRSAAPAAVIRCLLESHGSAERALAAGASAWRAAGLRDAHFSLLHRPELQLLQADRDWLAVPGHHLLGWHSLDYPALLRGMAGAPAALFVAGDPDLLWHPQIAVVGTRRPSAGGQDVAREFGETFARSGLAVTSGLAEGIDTAVHRGALEAGRTLAVVGTGLDRVYPASNAQLRDAIAANGAIVSEHPPGTPPLRQHFPSRNRLIAGLSLGTVVIEAAERSGALITARLAAEAGREVFAVPGSIRNPMARGCHRLIRQGANLIESPEEAIQALAPLAGELAERLRGRLEPGLPQSDHLAPGVVPQGASEAKLLKAMGHDPVGLDQLLERTGLTVPALSAMLLAMELDGQISRCEGRYSRRS